MTLSNLPPDAELARMVERHVPNPCHLHAVYLFGTAATATLRSDSDIDIAFLADRPLDPVAVFDAAQRLATELHRDVDLVDLRRASTVMRAQVIGHGRRLSCTDTGEVDRFEMYALSDHARLQEERRPVVRAMEQRYRG